MRKRSLSPLGYIMEHLNIQTASMSRSLHVDASLVSKWKTGGRNLTTKSIYFEDIIDYIMVQSTNDLHNNLTNALINLYPYENLDQSNNDEQTLERLLRQALSNKLPQHKSPANELSSESSLSTSALLYEHTQGRRDAIEKMLDFAEKMPSPGELIFIDQEEFDWLLEDLSYAHEFVTRFELLIHKGFHASFVLYHASYKGKIISLFDVCSPLIFHKNINWYYIEYYDKTLLNFSLYLLNHAISLVGLSADRSVSSTMIFTDNSLVIQHELMARHIIEQCKPIFTNFDMINIKSVIHDVSFLRKKGTLYFYLPSPMFLGATKDLLLEILKDNNIDSETTKKCLSYNQMLHDFLSSYVSSASAETDDRLIYLFHLEALLKRTKKREFNSRSLGLICEKPITILPRHYAKELRNLAERLKKEENIQIVLVSNKDSIFLPSINCWCKKDIWMLQMNQQGLRLSNEYNIVNAASTKWERCIHTVPAERKERHPVCQFLLEMAERLEKPEDEVVI